MAKYNSKSVYGTLFTMLDNLSDKNQEYLMENVFDEKFLEDIKDNPSKAYDVLNEVVVNIEDGKQDKISKLLADYKDKIYMMKNMLKDYGNFVEGENMKTLKERSKENEIIVSELQDTVEYFCGVYEYEGVLKGRALESLKNAIERLEIFNAIGNIYQWGVEVLNACGVKYKGLKENKSIKEAKNVKKSLGIIRHALMGLINDDTIQEEFNDVFYEQSGIYDSVDDMFEVCVHNVLNDVLKENTIQIIPF